MTARVAIISLASDFGCQVQMTNMEDHLFDVLSQFELVYWQLASSGHLPEKFDVAVIEGAVTTQEHIETLKRLRDVADSVIVIGACAVTGGIPGLAAGSDLESKVGCVYGEGGDIVARGRISPMPVDAVIDIDYRVLGCPIQPAEFVEVLQRALMGLSDKAPQEPLCASCKVAENTCFYDAGQICLGLVTRTGCGARCISHGRPCTGCRGIAEDANLPSARDIVASYGLSAAAFDSALELYSTCQEAIR